MDIIGSLRSVLVMMTRSVNNGRNILQSPAPPHSNSKQLELQILQVQESLRISILFLMWLLLGKCVCMCVCMCVCVCMYVCMYVCNCVCVVMMMMMILILLLLLLPLL